MVNESPVLSLILCSRNDSYMGNARWRLETALNYLANRVHAMGRERDVEVVLTDWGSEEPLGNVLALSRRAAAIVSFVHVPSALASTLQKDSPFPEVLALNAAARRARGAYIGRIDQDTLVGRRFLSLMFDLHEGRFPCQTRPESRMFFSNQRMLPYSFASRSPALAAVERFVDWYGRLLVMEHRNPHAVYYSAGVGIWLLHRHLWHECGGYDERMIYMNRMEVNMVRRLQRKYALIDLGPLVGHDFYHLEHYRPGTVRRSSTHRKVNGRDFDAPSDMNPNGDDWGLVRHDLPVTTAAAGDRDWRDDGVEQGLSAAELAGLVASAPTVLRDRALAERRKIRDAMLGWRRTVSSWRGRASQPQR